MTKKQTNRIEDLDGIAEQYASLKEDMTELRDDVTAFFHAVMDAGNSGLKDAQSRVSDEVQQRIDDMRQRLNAVRDRGRDSLAGMQSRIEEQPVKSVLIALAAGWLIAKIFGRR